MRTGWQERSYAVEIARIVPLERLATVSPAEVEAADDSGFLAGNAMYQNLNGLGWATVSAAVLAEDALIARLRTSADLEDEAEQIEEERSSAFDDAEGLWGLDVGVIGTVACLSALGCTPVGSCNAGGFGGQHQGQYPYVAFYLPADLAPSMLTLAEQLGLGLIVDDDGLAQLYADRDLGLSAFARLVAEQSAR